MGIKWQDRVTNMYLVNIEALILRAQLCWTGHLIQMVRSRMPLQFFNMPTGTRGIQVSDRIVTKAASTQWDSCNSRSCSLFIVTSAEMR